MGGGKEIVNVGLPGGVTISPPGPVSLGAVGEGMAAVWIFETGAWDDAGQWADASLWRDAP